MNTSELLVQALEREGVTMMFGIPGEENIAFLEALRTSSIQYITTADERGAVFMAAACGRLTGRPGVVCTTLGPGALNIPNGLAFATLAGIPVVALTWQSGCRSSNKDHGFMYVDVMAVLKPIVKYQQAIYSPQQVPNIIRTAFTIAQTPQFGAVHIEIFEDVSEEELTAPVTVQSVTSIATTIPDAASISAVATRLMTAKRPVMIVGFNASTVVGAQAVRNFAERTGIHVITTPMAQGILPSNHPLSLFSLVSAYDTKTLQALTAADMVLAVGYNTLEFSPKLWNPTADNAIVHINSVRAQLHQHYTPQVELIGDISTTLALLGEQITTTAWPAVSFQALHKLLSQQEVNSAAFPIRPQYLVQTLKKVVGDALIVHDNGMHKLWMTQFFHPDNPQQVLVDNALASMGSGIPQGIAAQLLQPQRTIVVNTGEGGLLMCLGELATAAALQLPLVIMVWHDGSYGMINWHQQHRQLPTFGVSITSPDFVKLAESFGGVGYRVTSAAALESIVQTACTNRQLAIIDCPVDYSENMKVFSNRTI